MDDAIQNEDATGATEAPATVVDESVVKVMGEELAKRAGDAAFDLRARVNQTLSLRPGQRLLVNTGLRVELPEGYAGLVLPRSGLAIKYGITVANAPGLIDSSFRGDIGVILHHIGSHANGDANFPIRDGDRIAQLLIVKLSDLAVEQVDELSESERGEGGFGSTGVA